MGKIISKSSAPERHIDLNSEGATDYGDQTPFLPYGDGRYKVRLTAFLFHDGFKGRAYRMKFKILESSRDDVEVGDIYMTQFKLGGDNVNQKRARMRQLRAVVAACYGQDPADESFDGNEALDTLCALSAANELNKDPDSTFDIEIVCRDKVLIDDKTKKPFVDENGNPKKVTNQFYRKA